MGQVVSGTGIMTHRAGIAMILRDLDLRSPSGFAIALHIRFSAPTYMFQTYAKRWLDQYTAEGLLLKDPVVRWGFNNVGRIRWADLEAIDDCGVMERAKDFGLMNGAAISLTFSGSRSIAGFARADRDFTEVELDELEAGLARLHRATLGLARISVEDREALTALSIRLTH